MGAIFARHFSDSPWPYGSHSTRDAWSSAWHQPMLMLVEWVRFISFLRYVPILRFLQVRIFVLGEHGLQPCRVSLLGFVGAFGAGCFVKLPLFRPCVGGVGVSYAVNFEDLLTRRGHHTVFSPFVVVADAGGADRWRWW